MMDEKRLKEYSQLAADLWQGRAGADQGGDAITELVVYIRNLQLKRSEALPVKRRMMETATKRKVAELEGAELDYWVTKALGWFARIQTLISGGVARCIATAPEDADFPWIPHGDTFYPSSSWIQGGPLLEREKITVIEEADGFRALQGIEVDTSEEICGRNEQFGATYLQAAMRCYVASKFGEYVEG